MLYKLLIATKLLTSLRRIDKLNESKFRHAYVTADSHEIDEALRVKRRATLAPLWRSGCQ
jgi:hypothetical protein